MELVLIGVSALLVSGLTLFSGFGLGTVLMPVFALFFPLPLAIAATAVVHFVATGVVSAVIVDAARLVVYGASFMAGNFAQSQELLAPVAVGTICAFVGSFLGKRMLQKVTLRTVQVVVAVAMLLIGVGLAVGLV